MEVKNVVRLSCCQVVKEAAARRNIYRKKLDGKFRRPRGNAQQIGIHHTDGIVIIKKEAVNK